MALIPGGTVLAQATAPAPNAARARADAVDALADYFAQLRSWGATRMGVVGNGSGTIFVPEQSKRIYCRLGNSTGPLAEALLLPLLNPAEGDKVMLTREHPGGPGGWVVVAWYGAGDVPIITCAPGFARVYVLYGVGLVDTADSLAPGGGTGSSYDNWYNNYWNPYSPLWISPSLIDQLTLSAWGPVADQMTYFYSSDNAASWSIVETFDTGVYAKPGFDLSSRLKGWGNAAELLTAGEKAAFDNYYDSIGPGWLDYDIMIANDLYQYSAVGMLHYKYSSDGGASWTTFDLENFAEQAPFLVYPGYSGSGGFLAGEDWAAWVIRWNACGPGHGCDVWRIDPYGGCAPHPAGFGFCGACSVGATVYVPTCPDGLVAPCHDGAHAYILFSPRYRYLYYDVACVEQYPQKVTNLIYRVDTAGGWSRIRFDPVDFGGFNMDTIFVAATNRLDDNELYVIVGALEQFGVVDFAGATLTFRTTPWDGNDWVERMVVSASGAIFVPALTNADGTLKLYISRDGGSTWSSEDFTAYATDPYNANPDIGIGADGTLAMATDAGVVIYSSDDGVTWNVTGAIVEQNLYQVDVDCL